MLEKALRYYKILGIIFLALVLLAVYATYAIFTKKYVAYDRVTLDTSTIGLQLPLRGDVKVRGVIVGEVLDYQPSDHGAQVTLGIYPDKIGVIPKNVSGAILPKTLFGEKYVSLVIPASPSSTKLAAGDTIAPTVVSTEVEAVLNDLYPLLRTVQPAQINMTLNAIATALQGRGDELGQSLETTNAYLKRLNPEIPQLLVDLRKTAAVSDTYASVLPQVAQILDNTVKTTGTLQSRQQKLHQLFQDVSGLSDTLRTFLNDNGQNLIDSSKLSATGLRVLARYSPEFPCLLRGITASGKLEAQAFRGFELHIVLETLPRQPRAYTAADRAVYGDNRGPNCLDLPHPPYSQAHPYKNLPNFKDGVNTPTGKGTDRVAPGFVSGSGYIGSPAESDLYRKLLSPGLGVPADQVGDLGPLLVGPMARGAEVTLR